MTLIACSPPCKFVELNELNELSELNRQVRCLFPLRYQVYQSTQGTSRVSSYHLSHLVGTDYKRQTIDTPHLLTESTEATEWIAIRLGVSAFQWWMCHVHLIPIFSEPCAPCDNVQSYKPHCSPTYPSGRALLSSCLFPPVGSYCSWKLSNPTEHLPCLSVITNGTLLTLKCVLCVSWHQ